MIEYRSLYLNGHSGSAWQHWLGGGGSGSGSHVELQGVVEIISNYPSTLRKVSELWPALRICVQMLDDLSRPVLEYLREVQTQQYLELDAPDRAPCPELRRYLFPAPALEDTNIREYGGNFSF